MKELSIEEKAKAYDEAIERAKKQLDEAKVFDYEDEQIAHDIRTTTYDIFPELKESEDERIRKKLIDYFKGFLEGNEDTYKVGGGVTWEGLDVKDVIAWLEKKGEQKPAWSEEDGNHVKSILSTIECCKAQFLNSPAVVEAYNADIEWLKSLRPQNTWKPSDEQMEALRIAGEIGSANNSWAMGVLKGMYQDLKKLKD